MANMELVQQFVYTLSNNGSTVLSQLSRHFQFSIYGVQLSAEFGIPVCCAMSRHRTCSNTEFGMSNEFQTIPSCAMCSIIMLGLCLCEYTVIVTVFLTSCCPIIKNTTTGMQNVDKNQLDAAKGMGKSRWQSQSMV